MRQVHVMALSVVAFVVSAASVVGAAVLEVPFDGGDASGVGYFSGWKCPPNDNISVVVDGAAPLSMASRLERGDTAAACANDGRNGYIAQVNFGLYGDGLHTAVVRQNGVPFAQSTFHVTTFGQKFLTGAGGTYQLYNFPVQGQVATVEWVQGAQNFIVVARSGLPQQCPTNGPLANLQVNCSQLQYLYQTPNGLVDGALATDGQVVVVCASDGPDVVCYSGPVQTATTFLLVQGFANGGPTFPVDLGSSGNITNLGQTMNFTVVVAAAEAVLQHAGFNYQLTAPLEAAVASAPPSSMGPNHRLLAGIADAFARVDQLEAAMPVRVPDQVETIAAHVHP